jgi:YVTN family beta-propeller protein
MVNRTVPSWPGWALAAVVLAAGSAPAQEARLPSGFSVTPLAPPGAIFQRLPTHLRADGSADANGAQTLALSPDATALLVLTSGYNTGFSNDAGKAITHPVPDPITLQPSPVVTPNAEFVFLYDVRGRKPLLRQALSLPNTYHGLAWQPDGRRFYVSGGIDDRIAVFATPDAGSTAAARFAPQAPFILLGHNSFQNRPLPARDGGLLHDTPIGRSPRLMAAIMGQTSALAAGLAASRDGHMLAAVNMQNDSLSLIDAATRQVLREIRFFIPGQKRAIGELPYWVALRSGTRGAFARAYVSSQRDGQILSVTPDGKITVIPVGGEPNRVVLSADQSTLYVANGDLDEIELIDTATDRLRRRISVLRPGDRLLGAGPTGLAQSPDGRTLYVTLGNENALAVVDLQSGQVRGRIPTGWFPADVAVSADGRRIFVVNAKSASGPSDYDINFARDDTPKPRADGHSGFVLALEKAGLLSFPLPGAASLAALSTRVDANNHFANRRPDPMMAFLRAHIHHVIYVLKENRTYDQVLGDIKTGNGDPSLCEFPQPVTPNHHALAERFALLDNFMSAGDVSGDGWNWMFAGHPNIYTSRTVPVGYGNASDTLPFDWNGSPRNIGIALPDTAAGPQNAATVRITTLLDPTGKSAIEPGPKDVVANEGTDHDNPGSLGGYIWDAVLRAGKTLRHYGTYADENYYISGSPVFLPIERKAGEKHALQAVPLRPALIGRTDPYYRGWDLNTPDEYRFEEWQREFAEYGRKGDLPDLEILEFNMDHFGNFATNVAGLNTPILQIASNDHALGELVQTVSRSRFWKDTAIFVVEDDAQDGPDHVDAHRTVAQVISPYTRAGATIHASYDTTNLLRTIEDILGVGPLGLNDANAAPMSDVFTRTPDLRPVEAIIPGVLCHAPVHPDLVPACRQPGAVITGTVQPRQDGRWWAQATQGMDFSGPDRADPAKFAAILKAGMQP